MRQNHSDRVIYLCVRDFLFSVALGDMLHLRKDAFFLARLPTARASGGTRLSSKYNRFNGLNMDSRIARAQNDCVFKSQETILSL